ncbi:MAG TPA: CUAEP/CCAEP-tail radical SAM protein [Candidatus Acidoferrales bacterium]|nr:CUAEP/CCAEP-tail radical SAM protein [Candidatus Acidoferrales bacterium]
MNVLLISTYELGRQPFGLASPAAWLRRAGAEVRCLDVSRDRFREEWVRAADVIAFYVPMHTATRLAVMLLEPVRRLNARARICFYGLYAAMNGEYLRGLGVESILGGEFEQPLVAFVEGLKKEFKKERAENAEGTENTGISLRRQEFLAPDRAGLPGLENYAHLRMPGGAHRIAGYTEASRGCKHLCRHCPIVPVYRGAFRIVQPDVVLADIRQQVAAGAQHITFGDPDFFNGPRHAMAIVGAMHREFPGLSYDATIKIEHLARHDDLLPLLRETGCAFVVTAAESVDDGILERLEKGHTRADFLAVVRRCREIGLALEPTFVPFTPWTTTEGYCDLLRVLVEEGLAPQVPPIQLAIRLLIPAGSLLLELEEVRRIAGAFDPAALVHPWQHPDLRVDALAEDVQSLVERGEKTGSSREKLFRQIWEAAHRAAGRDAPAPAEPLLVARAAVPYLTEPWYC